MKIDKFLHFWTQHNVAIIEILIGTILLISIYVAWKTLFSKDSGGAGGDAVHVDTAHIEQTLQKILENQAKAPVAAAPAFDLTAALPADAGDVPPEVAAKLAAAHAEVQRLTGEVESRNKQVEILQQQVAEAEKKAASAGEAAPAAAPAAGGADTSALEAKIKELESRLEEYEIISEDIADISKYKEENTKLLEENKQLKEEIQRLKDQLANQPAGGAGIPVDPALDIPSDVAALMEQPVAVEEVVEESVPDAAAEMAAEVAAEVAANPAEPVDVLSDDLMAEFEAAVAQQQQGTLAEEPAAPEPAAEAGVSSEVVSAKSDDSLAETEQLIGEFENFIKKG